jgi:NitT/TauT family transport system permease protein
MKSRERVRAVKGTNHVNKQAGAPVKTRDYKAYLPWITTPGLCFLIVTIWWAYVALSGISAFILPAPGAVWDAWIGLLGSQRAWASAFFTAYATLLGFFWAVLIGVGIGMVIARVRWLEQTLTPFIVASQVLPKVALVPLFIVWFGFGITSKVLIAAILAFFPILTNTVLGVKSIDQGHRDVMISLNATRWQVFRRLELQSALPYIITGMEVGIVLALIGSIVGEYLGGDLGLGHLLVGKMNAFETDGLFAVMIHMTILGFLFYFAISALRRIFVPWHGSAGPGAAD